MSYELLPASELLPYYPEATRETYRRLGIGGSGWQDLSPEQKLLRITDSTGDTPLQRIDFDEMRGSVHAKLELASPTGSHCDRQAHALLKMVSDGLIAPGVTEIDETSSGSLASSLAIHAPLAGIRLRARVPRSLDSNRLDSMRLPGVELELVDGYIPEAAAAMTARIKRLSAAGWAVKRHYTIDYRAYAATHPDGRSRGHVVFSNHSANPLTIESVRPLGLELARQLYEKHIVLDAMMLVIGNGTSVHGTVPALRQYQPGAAIIGVEDDRNHPTYDRKYEIPAERRLYAGHDSFGSSADGTPLRYTVEHTVDDIVTVAPGARDEIRDRFNARYPDIAIGNTSAMALKAAMDIIRSNSTKSRTDVGVIFYDGADRYDIAAHPVK